MRFGHRSRGVFAIVLLAIVLPAPVESGRAAAQGALGTTPQDESPPFAGGKGRSPEAAPAGLSEAAVEQTEHGMGSLPELVASFEGLGEGFQGPQGTARLRNPSDNSLAVGPDHIVQIVNTRMAIFTKEGARFDKTGDVLYGPVPTNNVFRGFAGEAAEINNGDAVVRYDQLADRWLIVMPIFRLLPPRENEPGPPASGAPAHRSRPGVEAQPGPAETLFQPPPRSGEPADPGQRRGRGQGRDPASRGSYAICYAVSTGPDPLGSYYRYQFMRPLFPDYPRVAVWPDGYYVTTSTGDEVIQKHVYVAEREKMLRGEPATEQGIILDGVNFLQSADLDGKELPPPGAPSIVMATGGAQLNGITGDDGIYVWRFHVDWVDPARTRLDMPEKIQVAPYRYLGGGQLSRAVPQPGTEQRLDAQGDKIMARLVYRRIGDRESIVAVHSVSTSAGGGGVRWYEFRLDEQRNIKLHQQGTYCPGGLYRWMASPAIDGQGNIGIGYSFGSDAHYPGQRFAARLADDPPGVLTCREAVLVEGEAPQTNTFRWEDYTQTAVDPSDDLTIWYVGDYLKQGAASYSTRIGAFRIAGGGNGAAGVVRNAAAVYTRKARPGQDAPEVIRVERIPDELRSAYRLDPFYKKIAVIDGIPIIGSEKVSDHAFLECAWIVDHMLDGLEKIKSALTEGRVRIGIIAATEYTMDIPENQRPEMLARAAYHDRRSRGLGGRTLTTCGEENLLSLRGDPYSRENITIHEFSHTIASNLRRVDRGWWDRLVGLYRQAKEEGLWANSYAATDAQEYWAEGTQSWFDCNTPRDDGRVHNGIWNRDKLKEYDPRLAAFLEETYGDRPWRYSKPTDRPAAELAHLAGLERERMPAFSFQNSPRIQAENAGRRTGPRVRRF